MNLTLLAICLIVASALYAVYRYATTPITWTVHARELLVYIDRLLRRGYDGSFVTISEPGTERFVQFAKYIKGQGRIGLEFAFPRTTWSEPYYDDLRLLLLQHGVALEKRSVNTPPTTEFLTVDCGRDTDLAFKITSIALGLFRVPSEKPLRVWFSHLSLHDELIEK
jgi:hypothetical protein